MNYNTGSDNTGNDNTGNRNTGNDNTGNDNTGNDNTGNDNTGCWNSTNNETGYFNSTPSDTIRFFNKPLQRGIFDKLTFPNWLFFSCVEWVETNNMTKEEKQLNPYHEVTGGFLHTISYKEAARKSYNKASREEQLATTKLPNYDPKVFEEIFGFRIKEEAPNLSGKKVSVTVDGKTYTATID
jgi:hypothetical protein